MSRRTTTKALIAVLVVLATMAVMLFHNAPKAAAASGFQWSAWQLNSPAGMCAFEVQTNASIHGNQWKTAVQRAANARGVATGIWNTGTQFAKVQAPCDEHPSHGRQLLSRTGWFIIGNLAAIVVTAAISVALAPYIGSVLPFAAPYLAAIVGCISGAVSNVVYNAFLREKPREMAIGAVISCVGGAIISGGAAWNAARAASAQAALQRASLPNVISGVVRYGDGLATESFTSARSSFSSEGFQFVEMVAPGSIRQPVETALARAFSG